MKKIKLDQQLMQMIPMGVLEKHPFEMTRKQLHHELDRYIVRHNLAVSKNKGAT